MAQFIVEDFHKTELDQLDPQKVREIMRKVVWAGAKVVEKETRNYIYDEHRESGDMARSVAQTDIQEDIDGVSVEIYPQGEDARGVNNMLKNKIIITGYYSQGTGAKKIKDPYVKKLRARMEPRILATMEYQFKLCMDELSK